MPTNIWEAVASINEAIRERDSLKYEVILLRGALLSLKDDRRMDLSIREVITEFLKSSFLRIPEEPTK